MFNTAIRILFAAALLLVSAVATAQPYPNKPLRLVIGFPPGAFTDVMARMLAEHLGSVYGQQVVVDNKPGAAEYAGRLCKICAERNRALVETDPRGQYQGGIRRARTTIFRLRHSRESGNDGLIVGRQFL